MKESFYRLVHVYENGRPFVAIAIIIIIIKRWCCRKEGYIPSRKNDLSRNAEKTYVIMKRLRKGL